MTDTRTAARPQATEDTACALCGRRDYRPVATVDRHGRPLTTVMCAQCGLVWTNPRPSDAEVDRYYATEYRLDYAKSRTPTPRKILRGLIGAAERIGGLQDLLRGGGPVLDVGCGAGEFVFLLRRRGIEAAGIEPGEEFAGFSRRVLGIPIQTTTVEGADVARASQRLITTFHMLEHVADPVATLTTLATWLAADGHLVVEVPNVDSLVQAPRNRFHYAHLYNYSLATLRGLAARAGLRMQAGGTSPDGGNLTCIFVPDAGMARSSGGVMPTPSEVAATARVLARTSGLRHYLRWTPYGRVLDRLRRRQRENRLLRSHRSIEALLDWAVAEFAEPRLH